MRELPQPRPRRADDRWGRRRQGHLRSNCIPNGANKPRRFGTGDAPYLREERDKAQLAADRRWDTLHATELERDKLRGALERIALETDDVGNEKEPGALRRICFAAREMLG